MQKPNLFIVGAPKCGTTALAAYLGEHPDIFISDIKEPHFFSDDLPGRQCVTTLDDYLALFAHGAGKKIVGEGSVHYLFSTVAIANILAFNPAAKLVVMLRNPVEMVHSLHGEYLHGLNENETDFERAWALQESRARGMHLPPYGKDPVLLQYRRVASYSEHVARMMRHFPKEQIKIIIYDDFKHDTRRVYAEVLDFLGVPNDGRTDFNVINSSHAFRIKALGVLLWRKPMILRKTWSVFKTLFGLDERVGQAVGNWLHGKNTVTRPRRPLSAEMKARLVKEFSDDISKLEALIGRDLSHWKGIGPGKGEAKPLDEGESGGPPQTGYQDTSSGPALFQPLQARYSSSPSAAPPASAHQSARLGSRPSSAS